MKFGTAHSLSTGLTGLTFLKLRMNQPIRRIHKYMVIMTAYVVYWSEFLATDTEVPGSILGATRFSE
jgi:hypothetical protein